MGVPVMRHRIACNFAAQAEGVDSVEIVRRLIEAVPEPQIPKYTDTTPAPDLANIEIEQE